MWIAGIASGGSFLDEPDGAVFARIAYLSAHPEVSTAEQIGGWSMIAAAVAIVAHLIAALALQSERTTPLWTSIVVALAGMVMVPGWAAFAAGIEECAGVRMTGWFFVVLGSGVVVAVCGVLLWRIALDDRRRAQIERVLRRSGPPAAYLLER